MKYFVMHFQEYLLKEEVEEVSMPLNEKLLVLRSVLGDGWECGGLNVAKDGWIFRENLKFLN